MDKIKATRIEAPKVEEAIERRPVSSFDRDGGESWGKLKGDEVKKADLSKGAVEKTDGSKGAEKVDTLQADLVAAVGDYFAKLDASTGFRTPPELAEARERVEQAVDRLAAREAMPERADGPAVGDDTRRADLTELAVRQFANKVRELAQQLGDERE